MTRIAWPVPVISMVALSGSRETPISVAMPGMPVPVGRGAGRTGVLVTRPDLPAPGAVVGFALSGRSKSAT
jgi:hypothetical protein